MTTHLPPSTTSAGPARIETLLAHLRSIFAGYGGAVVAFSAGADSTLVAAIAAEVLGGRALAVTGRSPSLPEAELAAAGEIATQIGIRHQIVDTDEMSRPGYVANAGDRCYHCKTELYDHVTPIAEAMEAVICNGANLDDLGDYRPGMRAANEHDVRSPLLEAGCTKSDVRAISHHLGLPTWDKPAMACLASRIPNGTPVRVELLGQVEAAEAYLRSLGLHVLRVRHHGEIARIETDAVGLEIVTAQREAIVTRLTSLGFRFVALDLAEFCSGSLNPPSAH